MGNKTVKSTNKKTLCISVDGRSNESWELQVFNGVENWNIIKSIASHYVVISVDIYMNTHEYVFGCCMVYYFPCGWFTTSEYRNVSTRLGARVLFAVCRNYLDAFGRKRHRTCWNGDEGNKWSIKHGWTE